MLPHINFEPPGGITSQPPSDFRQTAPTVIQDDEARQSISNLEARLNALESGCFQAFDDQSNSVKWLFRGLTVIAIGLVLVAAIPAFTNPQRQGIRIQQPTAQPSKTPQPQGFQR